MAGTAGADSHGNKGGIPSCAVAAGFKHIDAVSFVSPKAVPQLADSEDVLKELEVPEGVEIVGIVVNEKGADRAIATRKVTTLDSPTPFRLRSSRTTRKQTPEEALDELEKIGSKAFDAGFRYGGVHLDGIRESLWR